MQLRPILPQEDDLFLFELYASSRRAEIMDWGWDENQQQQFLRMQYQCQQRSYTMQYPALAGKIILYEGVRAGRLLTAYANDELVLVDITLLPEYRNKGLGTKALCTLQEEAKTAGVALRLSVFQGNPAQQLYEKQGFQISAVKEPYFIMRWQAPKI